uniref:toprim domain-containing protein n=1 Tax=Sneathiella glossodoripedis TaxID=418853 RepID=UPI00047089F6
YMDVIALSQAGFMNSVAPLGTAVTEEQLQILWKMAAEPIMCLDGDAAGWRAALRAAERALPLLKPGYSLRFCLLPEGVDPDDLVRRDGPDAMRTLLDQSLPLSELLWRKEIEGRQLETPEQKAAFEKALERTLEEMQEPTVRGYYRQYFKNRLFEWNRENNSYRSGGWTGGQKKQPAKDRFGRFANQKGRFDQKRDRKPLALSAESWGRGEKLLILTVLNHPEILDNYFDIFAALKIKAAHLDRVHAAIIEIAASESDLDYERLKHQLSIRGLSEVVARLEQSSDGSLDWFIARGAALEDAIKGWLHLLARQKREELEREVKAAEKIFGEEATRENLDRLKNAKEALQNAEGNEVDLDGFGVASGRNTGF